MVELDIGSNETEAKVAIPASGSFVGFLLSEYGLDLFIEKWIGGSWEIVYGKPLNELEKNWLTWHTPKQENISLRDSASRCLSAVALAKVGAFALSLILRTNFREVFLEHPPRLRRRPDRSRRGVFPNEG